MNSWNDGYITDIEYTYGYYTELNPVRATFAFLNKGLTPPQRLFAAPDATACELGFGQGMSVNIHAAAGTLKWYGTDFNPGQTAFAQEAAAAAQSGARLFDDSFEEFLNRPDLPDFDYIALHGIWSWISTENRQYITDFIDRKLKVGGVVYISYNTLPGWTDFAPLRHLMLEHSRDLSAAGSGVVQQVEGALGFLDKLIQSEPLFARSNPLAAKRLEQFAKMDRHYLAHEFFNLDWAPLYFEEMAAVLEQAKLSFACSATYLEHIDGINLTAAQRQLLSEIPSERFKETVRDFMVNQQFRRDYWVKGERRLSSLEAAEQIRALPVMLLSEGDNLAMTVHGALGDAQMNESVYRPVLKALADHEIKSVAEVEKLSGLTLTQVQEALMVLVGQGHVYPVQSAEAIEQCAVRAAALNRYLMKKSRFSGIGYLASPVTGGGINVDRLSQLMLLGISEGRDQVKELSSFVFDILNSQGQRLIKDGQTLESEQDNRAELMRLCETFKEKALPLYQRLRLI
ncbi:MAG: methyltransferase regulatory domain-containing protein [Succinivibrio sp.]|nr:methyltransferase regulatory domain-containing protein [Succinivibrio sp.]